MSKSYLRNVIGEYMSVLGEKNDKVLVINADLAATCRNKTFKEKFPGREFSVGIAEQNMVSFAAGLSLEGFIPFVFSMAPFLTMRACEQVRTDVAYGNKNVKLISVYSGVSGGVSGATHWGLEDIGIVTSMPGINVIETSDKVLAEKMLELSVKYDGPVYIRCSVEPCEDIYDASEEFSFGGSKTVFEGKDGAVLCAGVTVGYALEAVKEVEKETGKRFRVVDLYSIKPIDKKAVIDAAKTGKVIVAHDHNVYGGLGSMVSKVICEEGMSTKFVNIGVPDRFDAMAHAPYLYEKYGYDVKGIKEAILKMI